MSGRSPRKKRRLIAAAVIAEPILMKLRGYPMGGNIIVRCREGHLFTTLWLPAVSLKSVRLVWWRFQRCPVGNHWTIVTPVREAELSPGERRRARARHDIRLP